MATLNLDQLTALGFRSLGVDVRISDHACIHGAERISLGSHVRIDDFVVISAGEGGIQIGNYIHIGAQSSLIGGGSITVGDFANISGKVAIYSSNDDYSGEWMTNPMVPSQFTNVQRRPVVIGRHVIVGAGSVILPGVAIADGCSVGALSLVKDDLPELGIYAGVPAVLVRPKARRVFDLEVEFLEVQP